MEFVVVNLGVGFFGLVIFEGYILQLTSIFHQYKDDTINVKETVVEILSYFLSPLGHLHLKVRSASFLLTYLILQLVFHLRFLSYKATFFVRKQ